MHIERSDLDKADLIGRVSGENIYSRYDRLSANAFPEFADPEPEPVVIDDPDIISAWAMLEARSTNAGQGQLFSLPAKGNPAPYPPYPIGPLKGPDRGWGIMGPGSSSSVRPAGGVPQTTPAAHRRSQERP